MVSLLLILLGFVISLSCPCSAHVYTPYIIKKRTRKKAAEERKLSFLGKREPSFVSKTPGPRCHCPGPHR